MRTAEQLMDELTSPAVGEILAGLILILTLPEDNGTIRLIVHADKPDALWELKEAMAVGAQPLGIVRALQKESGEQTVSFGLLQENCDDPIAIERLKNSAMEIRERILRLKGPNSISSITSE